MPLLIKNANELVTVSGNCAKCGSDMRDIGVIQNGAVLMDDGVIVDIDTTDDILKRHDVSNYEVIDATGKAVLPGFIDPHTHFVFGGYRVDEFTWRLQGQSYMDIMKKGGGIASSTAHTRSESYDELYEKGYVRLNTFLEHGVTTVEGKSGYGLDMDNELKQLEVLKQLNKEHSVNVVSTFMGAHAVPRDHNGNGKKYLEFLSETVMPVVKQKNLAEFCDIFCEEGVFSVDESRAYLDRAKEMGFKIKLHADEVKPLGGAELAAQLGAISADHLLAASDEGISNMLAAGVIAVLLPATAFCLNKPYANARKMINSGLAVAIASDFNPGSCFTQSLPLVIALSALKMNMTAEEIVTAATLNAAAAIDRADKIGSLDVGKKADVVILKYPSYKYLVYNTAQNIVEHVIKNNKIIF